MVGKQKNVKELNVEIDKLHGEVETLKTLLKSVKQEFSAKIQQLEEKLKESTQETNNFVKNKNSCRQCQKSFETSKELKLHRSNEHKIKYKCTRCDETFQQLSEMENHEIYNHDVTLKFKCENCDSEFVSELRLKIHKQSHKHKTKYCHYYNNGKVCPFQKLGCRFKHEESQCRRYIDKCKKPLCGFKHENGSDIINNSKKSQTKITDSEDKMNEGIINSEGFNYDEYEEAKEMVCEHYCDNMYGYHVHYDDLYQRWFGVDTPNVTERNVPVTKERTVAYPCRLCVNMSNNLDEHEIHMKKNHPTKERILNCLIENCEYTFAGPESLSRHIAVKHNDYIKEKLKEEQQ